MVDIDPDALYAKHLSATDVSNALNLQNLILPAGTAKVGDREYLVRVNSSPEVVQALNDLPVKTVNGATVYHEGRRPGARRLRGADQHRARERRPRLAADGAEDRQRFHARHRQRRQDGAAHASWPACRRNLHVTTLLDQSLFVRAAVQGVVREALIAAVLTG